MSNNLIDVQQMKNVYDAEKQILKLGLLNIRSFSTKALFVNYLITDHKLDVNSSQITFIYIALLTIQIVSKQVHNIKTGKCLS